MIINVANLQTIKDFLQSEFLKQSDADISIKICTCIELIDLLEENEKGYQIKYDKELEVNKSQRKIKQNSISY